MSSTGQTTTMRYTAGTFVGKALLKDDLRTETATGLTDWTPRSPNLILDITYEVAVAGATPMALFTRRSTDQRKLLVASANASPTFTGNQRAGYPIGLKAGFYQIVEQQLAGTLAVSQAFVITLQKPLDV